MSEADADNDHSAAPRLKSDYALWLGASTSDMLGRSLCNIALPYVIVSLTGSTGSAGLVETVGMVAYLAVTLFGGVVVDRIDRRRGMYARGLSGAVLWLALALLLVSGMLRLWHVFVIVVAIRVLDGLFGMADNAALRSIVTDDVAFTRAVSINQARNAVVRIGGGPLGGFLYGIVHALPFFVASVLLALLALLARLIRVDLRPPQPSEHNQSQDPDQPSKRSPQGDDHTASAVRPESG
ncbi:MULTISPECIES: MFS transporter [unclassified Actinobaculum]|uniref:MFS transporter n=1 Tax=unclassified Actinobaculum TaxID=2609299 RepID=UPI0013DE16AF|nr:MULTISPECIES: MFS transporter [unclassified Actinobaculum]